MPSGNPSLATRITGEEHRLAAGPLVLLSVLYLFGILLGVTFAALWAMGLATWMLGVAGLVFIAGCLYMAPETVRPLISGQSLVIGDDRFQFTSGKDNVIGQVPYSNVAEIVLNGADGGKSLWVRLDNPESPDTFWPGGSDLMNVIYSQCEYHLVVGKGLQTPAPTLLEKLSTRAKRK